MSDICGWCDAPAVTQVITRPGRKNRKTAPVCEAHALDFEGRGMMTIRLEFDQKQTGQQKRRQWLQRNRTWR